MAALNQPCLNIAMAAMVSQRIPRRSPRNAKSKHFSPWWPQERPTYAATQWLGPDFFGGGRNDEFWPFLEFSWGEDTPNLVGGLVSMNLMFIYIYIRECHHPNWRTPSFFTLESLYTKYTTGWWFGTFFSCFPFYSGMSSCQVTIFQRARAKNHQKSTKILPMWPRWLLRRTACLALFNQQARRSVGL